MKTHEVTRTNEIPPNVVSLGCNWCPSCEDSADDYYHEWYNESDENESENHIPDNQLALPLSDIVPNKELNYELAR